MLGSSRSATSGPTWPCFSSDLWMHTLVELWAWNRNHDELSIEATRPGTTRSVALCTPTVAKLQEIILQNELSTITAAQRLPRKIIQLAQRLMALAA